MGIRCGDVCRLTVLDVCTDGIFGEVLFYTLRKTLGTETYSAEIHYAWVKVMSRILRVMIPIVVRYEMSQLSGGADGSENVTGRTSSRSIMRGYQPHLQQDGASMHTNRTTIVHSGDLEGKTEKILPAVSTSAT